MGVWFNVLHWKGYAWSVWVGYWMLELRYSLARGDCRHSESSRCRMSLLRSRWAVNLKRMANRRTVINSASLIK